MNTKQWNSDIAKSIRHVTASEILADKKATEATEQGTQYTRLLAIRDLKAALTTLRKLGEKRETLKEAVDTVCNKIK